MWKPRNIQPRIIWHFVSSYKEELTAKSQTAVLPVLTFKKKIDVTNLTVFPSKKKPHSLWWLIPLTRADRVSNMPRSCQAKYYWISAEVKMICGLTDMGHPVPPKNFKTACKDLQRFYTFIYIDQQEQDNSRICWCECSLHALQLPTSGCHTHTNWKPWWY